MTPTQKNTGANKWLVVLAATGLLVSFFLPWVSWQGILIKGYDMPAGNFFRVSATEFGLDNPLPQLSIAFYVFWLIPAGALASITLIATNKKPGVFPFITAALSLSLLAVFFLFTQKLIMLGVGENVFDMLRPAAWVHAISAIALIISLPLSRPLLKKTIWIVAGPVFVFISFLLMEKYLMNKTYDNTATIKAEYEVTASGLIREFTLNDSAANKKYREKIIIVNGNPSEVDIQSDSTVNIKFTDSTGSYIIFSLDKNQYEKASTIQTNETVSLKGSCSGSVYSDILGTSSISFKRATINNK